MTGGLIPALACHMVQQYATSCPLDISATARVVLCYIGCPLGWYLNKVTTYHAYLHHNMTMDLAQLGTACIRQLSGGVKVHSLSFWFIIYHITPCHD